VVREIWPSPVLTDIHDRAAKPRKDVQNGDHGRQEEAITAVVLAIPSTCDERDPSLFQEEQAVPCAREPRTYEFGGFAIRILTTPEELSDAIERAEIFERRNAEHLAARHSRHAAALEGNHIRVNYSASRSE